MANELKTESAAVKDKDGKVLRPAIFTKEIATTRIERFTETQIDNNIERATAELAKWTALKAEIAAVK
jgi:hypothetical protein